MPLNVSKHPSLTYNATLISRENRKSEKKAISSYIGPLLYDLHQVLSSEVIQLTHPLNSNLSLVLDFKGQCPTKREVPEPADRRLQTRRMPLWNALDCFITENLVLPVMYDSVHSVLVKQHGYIQWTNCTKKTLLGSQITIFKSVKLVILQF